MFRVYAKNSVGESVASNEMRATPTAGTVSYTITYTITPAGSGTVTPATCTLGTTVTPVCSPNAGYSTSSCPAAFTCATTNTKTATFISNNAHTTPDRPIVPAQSGVTIASPDTLYVTTASSITFQVACIAGDTIRLYDTTTLLASKTCGATSPETISVSVPPVDKMMYIAATISDATHAESKQSERITVYNDPTSRSAPGTPDLVESSDLGSFNTDNITSKSKPEFSLTCISGNTVNIYKDTTTLVGAGSCLASTATITLNQPLSDGNHTFTAQQTNPTT